jgi:hypothetical protein
VIVAVTGADEVFVAVKPGVFPVPLAARPIELFELFQLKVVPATLLVNADAGTAPPLQTMMFAGTTTFGVGLTVIVYETGVPTQLPIVGVTVTVET